MSFNTTMLIGTLIIAIISFSFTLFFIDMGSRYDFVVEEQYQTLFNEYADAQAIVETQEEIIEGGEINPEGQDQAVYSSVIVAGKQSITVTKTIWQVITDGAQYLNIGSVVYGMIFSIITILAISSFIWFIVGRRQ